MNRRLGVRRALVAGAWVEGDVEVGADGTIAAVGASPAGGRGCAAPGFVDLQVNGFSGVDLRDADSGGYARVAEALVGTGTTAFLPTFYSCTIDRYEAALSLLADVRACPPPGARIGRAHLEGPFLSTAWAGAHDPARLLGPDSGVLRRLLDAGPVALVTVAPESAGALVAELRGRDVVVSMGHTDATAGHAAAAVDRGVTMITHCWNAHRRFTPRDPGPAGLALADPRVTIGLICDLRHVAPETVVFTFAAAAGRVAIVSDSIAPAGSEVESWVVDDAAVTVTDGAARLADGTLAGAVCPIDEAVRNVIWCGIDPAVALSSASTVPAAVLGRRHNLQPGDAADVVVLDDGWKVTATLVGGVDAHIDRRVRSRQR